MKTAIVILSDPDSKTDESFGRMFNALATAYDYDGAGEEVQILFNGPATRWPEVLGQPDHPAYDLYQSVRHTVTGVSCGCADAFGAAEGAAAAGLEVLTENAVPGTTGLPSFRRLRSEGFDVLTF